MMGWLFGWGYRKSHVINGVASGPLSNYCVRITAHKGAGVDSGEDIYLGANVRNDFGDVRFTGDDGTTLLDYWMEEKVDGNYAVFWVEVGSIPASPGSVTVYIYYSNAIQTTTSNGDATFLVFDHFEGSALDGTKWDSSGTVTVSGSQVHVGASSYIGSKTAFPYNRAAHGRSKANGDNINLLLFSDNAFNNFDDIHRTDGAVPQFRTNSRKDPNQHTINTGVVKDTAFHIFRIYRRGTGYVDYYVDATMVTESNTLYIPTINLKAFFRSWSTNTMDADYIFIRNYVSPEPSHGAWGSEETTPIPPPNKIDLRLSDVTPPDPDIPKTIYRDLFNLPATMKLGITIRYFNWDDVQLYFRVTGLAPGYSFGTVSLGALASGGSAYRNLDQFASRSKPAGEVEEEIILILRAYTDVAYTNLKWTYERVVHVVIIDSNDPGYTVDFLNNFDDGTVQGWAVSKEYGPEMDGGHPVLEVVTDYVLSAPYSIRMRGRSSISIYQDPCYMYAENRVRLYKSFTTPDRANVFAIFDLRSRAIGSGGIVVYVKYLSLQRDGVVQVFWGRPVDAAQAAYYPTDRWIRGVIPLPRNTVVELRIVSDWRMHNSTGTSSGYGENQIYMDDFRIISKA